MHFLNHRTNLPRNEMGIDMKTKFAVLILLATAFSNASAASFSQQFLNDFSSNRIWLWAVEPTTEFTNVSFDNAAVSDWVVPVDTGSTLYLESSTETPLLPGAGRFTIDFDYTTPTFSFEWAEIYWDGATNNLLGSGTATYNGSGWSGGPAFTHAAALSAVPIPASSVLLASGVVFGIGVGRRKAS